MNGFTNGVLSLLLSWIRLFVSQFWRMVNSDDGARVVSFLAENWKTLALILCVGGFVTDRVIYLLRWRPDYVWRSKLRRLRRRRAARDRQPEAEEYASAPAAPQGDAPAYEAYRPYSPPLPAQPAFEATRTYFAPSAAGAAAPVYDQPFFSGEDISPVFDDDSGWAQGDQLLRPDGQSLNHLGQDMDGRFGSAMPEPLAYLRDMQAGFARPLPPEELYQKPAPPQIEETPIVPDAGAPVHPGLDPDRFRDALGIDPNAPVLRPPTFAPYAETLQSQAATKTRRPFSALAKRARDFVGIDGEEDTRTIHDLQPMVDMRTAFHKPVYPKRKEEDDL